MLHTYNDTPDYVLAIDGYFERFKTKHEAQRIIENMIKPEITPFGQYELLSPWHVPLRGDGHSDFSCKVSDKESIDIKDYIQKNIKRIDAKQTHWEVQMINGRVKNYQHRKNFLEIIAKRHH
jgi:hypothetical protein